METYLLEKNIFLHGTEKTKEEVFTFIANKAHESGVCCDPETLEASFAKREEEGSTGMKDGFAIPHATNACIEKPALYVLKTDNPIPWKTMDESEVNVVIALLLPDDAPTKHLTLLSKIAALLLQPNFCNHIQETDDVAEIAKTFNQGLN